MRGSSAHPTARHLQRRAHVAQHVARGARRCDVAQQLHLLLYVGRPRRPPGASVRGGGGGGVRAAALPGRRGRGVEGGGAPRADRTDGSQRARDQHLRPRPRAPVPLHAYSTSTSHAHEPSGSNLCSAANKICSTENHRQRA